MGNELSETTKDELNTYVTSVIKMRQAYTTIAWLAERIETISAIYKQKKGIGNTHGKDLKELKDFIDVKKQLFDTDLKELNKALEHASTETSLTTQNSVTSQAASTASHYADRFSRQVNEIIKKIETNLTSITNNGEKLKQIKTKTNDHHYYRLLILTLMQLPNTNPQGNQLSKIFNDITLNAIPDQYTHLIFPDKMNINLTPPNLENTDGEKSIEDQAIELSKNNQNIGYCPALEKNIQNLAQQPYQNNSITLGKRASTSSPQSLSRSSSSIFNTSSGSSGRSSPNTSAATSPTSSPRASRKSTSNMPPLFIAFGNRPEGVKMNFKIALGILYGNPRLEKLENHIDRLVASKNLEEAKKIIEIIHAAPKYSDTNTAINELFKLFSTPVNAKEISKKASELIGAPPKPARVITLKK